MNIPEFGEFPSETYMLEDRIRSAAKLVLSYLSDDFAPLTAEEIAEINQQVILNGEAAILQSGALRAFDTEDASSQSPVRVQEAFYRGEQEGGYFDGHYCYIVVHKSGEGYLCTIDLDDDEMTITAGESHAEVSDDNFPALCKQMLGSLSLIADTLILAS
jgi:hypothetical protein